MRPSLLDLLEQDVYSNAVESAARVAQVKEAVRDIKSHLANATLIQVARELYQTDDVEIDDYCVETSRAAEGQGDGENGQSVGTWVQAWVWVPDNEITAPEIDQDALQRRS